LRAAFLTLWALPCAEEVGEVMWPSPPHFFASLTPHLDNESSLRRHNRFCRRHLFKNSPDNIVPHCQYNVVVGLNHSGDIQTPSHSHTDEGLVLEWRALHRAIDAGRKSYGGNTAD